jgi:hypothetical protein
VFFRSPWRATGTELVVRALRAMSDDGADEARTPRLACALRQAATSSRAALVL